MKLSNGQETSNFYQKTAILCAKIRHLKNRTSPKPGARTTVSIIPRLFIDGIVRNQLREKIKKKETPVKIEVSFSFILLTNGSLF